VRPTTTESASGGRGANGGDGDGQIAASAPVRPKPDTTETTETLEFAADSYIVRMDQPYCRIADMLLDKQFWSPNDPQKQPYNDTAWSFPELFNVRVTRVVDPAMLKAKWSPSRDRRRAGGVAGTGRSSPSITVPMPRSSRSATD
jgi:hypothetical protein